MMPLVAFLAVSLAAIAGLHIGLLGAVWPIDRTMNVGLLLANAFFLANYRLRFRHESTATQIGYFVGYAALFALIYPLLRALGENMLVWVLLLMLYVGLFARPFLTGYLFLFVVCTVYAAAFRWEAFLLLSVFYTGGLPLRQIWRDEDNRLVPGFYVAGGVLLFCLLLPILYLSTQATSQSLIKTLEMPEVRAALWRSLWTATAATAATALLAVPLAYVLVRREFPGKFLINLLVDLPLLVPPPVAGIALFTLLGPNSAFGREMADTFGLKFLSSIWGILIVQVFVGAPFLVRSSMIAFAGIDAHYERVARTLGATAAGAFFRITLPLALPGIFLGAILMWFRAIGEFGATYIFAPSPETAPILIYNLFLRKGPAESHPVIVLLLMLFLSIFAAFTALRWNADRAAKSEQ